LGSAAAKRRLVAGRGDETLRTTVFDIVRKIDWPRPFTGRALANDHTRRWHGREQELAAALESESPRYWAASDAGDVATAVVWASEAVDLIHAVEPAGVILERIVAEAQARIAASAQLVTGG
jgi:nitronate monooxygenase